MNNKTIYRIIYGIIIACIVCIILVYVLSTGNKEWDWGLGIFSVVGILASGVYLIYKNKKTAKVAPDLNPNSSTGAADDKNLLPNLPDEATSNFINYVQENNNKLNTIIINYIEYLKTQDKNINVMHHFDNNVQSKIVVPGLFNIIRNKAWMVYIGIHPDSDPNSLGTGDR